jgi:hypothetical protein
MKVVVIGGHTRNIGKTSVMCALIREFSWFGWTAVKITQYGHGICSRDGQPCSCAPTEHPFALTEETNAQGRTDTCRYVAAGARQSLWLRARQGQLATALPLLFRRLRDAEWAILESNSILEFIEPLLYLVVLDGSRRDFKASAQKSLARADAFISVNRGSSTATRGSHHEAVACAAFDGSIWPEFEPVRQLQTLRSKPLFPVYPTHYWSAGVAGFVRSKLDEAIARSLHPAVRSAAVARVAGRGTSDRKETRGA